MPDGETKGAAANTSAAASYATRQIALETYMELVDRCAAGRLNQAISNGSPFHARILISKLFEIARKRVQIVSGRLTDTTSDEVEVYGFPEIIVKAKKFLRDPSACLSIVVQSGIVDKGVENRFLKEIVEDKDRNGLVELVIAAPGTLNENVPHFMTSDASAYRFEPGANAQPANQTTTAIGNFGDAPFARSLDEYFGTIVNHVAINANSRRCVFSPNVRELALPA